MAVAFNNVLPEPRYPSRRGRTTLRPIERLVELALQGLRLVCIGESGNVLTRVSVLENRTKVESSLILVANHILSWILAGPPSEEYLWDTSVHNDSTSSNFSWNNPVIFLFCAGRGSGAMTFGRAARPAPMNHTLHFLRML